MSAVTGMIVMAIFDTLPYSICVEVFGSAKAADTSSVVLFMSGVGLVMGSLLGELHHTIVALRRHIARERKIKLYQVPA